MRRSLTMAVSNRKDPTMDTRTAALHRLAKAAWDAGRIAEWAMHCATIAKAEARRIERQQVAA